MSRPIYLDTTNSRLCILDEHSRHTGGEYVNVDYIEKTDYGYRISMSAAVERRLLQLTPDFWEVKVGE